MSEWVDASWQVGKLQVGRSPKLQVGRLCVVQGLLQFTFLLRNVLFGRSYPGLLQPEKLKVDKWENCKLAGPQTASWQIVRVLGLLYCVSSTNQCSADRAPKTPSARNQLQVDNLKTASWQVHNTASRQAAFVRWAAMLRFYYEMSCVGRSYPGRKNCKLASRFRKPTLTTAIYLEHPMSQR